MATWLSTAALLPCPRKGEVDEGEVSDGGQLDEVRSFNCAEQWVQMKMIGPFWSLQGDREVS
jgi:hypothetical protein